MVKKVRVRRHIRRTKKGKVVKVRSHFRRKKVKDIMKQMLVGKDVIVNVKEYWKGPKNLEIEIRKLRLDKRNNRLYYKYKNKKHYLTNKEIKELFEQLTYTHPWLRKSLKDMK